MNDRTYVMTDEEWDKNKDCEASRREHKWNWKWDISGQWTDMARCAHCGKETIMKREHHVTDNRKHAVSRTA